MLKLIKFGADFCQPCKTLDAILNNIDSVEIEKVDIMEDQNRANENSVRKIPTMILTKNNQEIWRHVGVLPQSEIESKIKEFE